MDAIQSEGWKLKMEKCNFANNETKYVGFKISENEISPMRDNLVAIKNFPTPSSVKNVRQFLGKVNFYHKYIPNYSRVLEPLHNLLRKTKTFQWDENCETSFTIVKKYLISAPALSIFDPKLQTNIYTDASTEGLGAILKQIQQNNEEKTVAYFSRKLTPYQKKKKAIYLECLAIREAIKHWKYWLLGKCFTIFTDHKPLENFNVKVRPDEELGNLLNQISQFDFSITYRPGQFNSEADCLSRNSVLDPTPDVYSDIIPTSNFLSFQEISNDQQNFLSLDSTSSKLITYKNSDRIILSSDLGKLLISKIHVNFGHIGQKHISAIIRPYYYFSGIDELIKSSTKECIVCIKNKTRRSRKFGLLGHLGPATSPFEILSLDTIGGLSEKKTNKKYLHLIADHFSRFAFGFPSSSMNTKEFIRIIDTIHSKNKIKNLLTDQYPAFTSTEFRNFTSSQGINHIFTTTDSPESDGLNERLNQTIVNRIRCKKNSPNESRSWPTLANEVISEYNNTPHSVTTFSPRFLLTGESVQIAPNTPLHSVSLDKAHQIALENSNKNHDYNKSRIDSNRKEHSFNINDLVFVEKENKLNRSKLDEIRIGPFSITRKISDSIYEIKCGSKPSDLRKFHVTKLIPIN